MKLINLLEEVRVSVVGSKLIGGVNRINKGTVNKVNRNFNNELKKVFTISFLNKVYSKLPNKIRVEIYIRGESQGYTIFSPGPGEIKLIKKLNKDINVNLKRNFKKSNRIYLRADSSLKVLVHEFIHLIEQRRYENHFPEILKLKEELLKSNFFSITKHPVLIQEMFSLLYDGNKSTYLSLLNPYTTDKDLEKTKRIINKYRIFKPEFINDKIDTIFAIE